METTQKYSLPAIPICPGCREELDGTPGTDSLVCWSEDCPFNQIVFEPFNLLRIMQWMDGEGPCQPIRTDDIPEVTDASKGVRGKFHLDTLLSVGIDAALDQDDESEIEERSRAMMRTLLDQITVILKGPNPPNGLHSWHDLPELTQALIDKVPLREAYIKELERQLWGAEKGS